jgi:hypothetical protein
MGTAAGLRGGGLETRGLPASPRPGVTASSAGPATGAPGSPRNQSGRQGKGTARFALGLPFNPRRRSLHGPSPPPPPRVAPAAAVPAPPPSASACAARLTRLHWGRQARTPQPGGGDCACAVGGCAAPPSPCDNAPSALCRPPVELRVLLGADSLTRLHRVKKKQPGPTNSLLYLFFRLLPPWI